MSAYSSQGTLTLLDDRKRKGGEVSIDDATADGLSLALARATRAVAALTLAEEQADAAVGQHALLHGEALLVVSASNAQNVALKIIVAKLGY